MADVSIKYKNSEIASLAATGTKTLNTAGKYCEGNISVEYTRPSGSAASPAFQTFSLTVTDNRSNPYFGPYAYCADYTYDSATNRVMMRMRQGGTSTESGATWNDLQVPARGEGVATAFQIPWISLRAPSAYQPDFSIASISNCYAAKYSLNSNETILLIAPTSNGVSASVTLGDPVSIIPASGVSF